MVAKTGSQKDRGNNDFNWRMRPYHGATEHEPCQARHRQREYPQDRVEMIGSKRAVRAIEVWTAATEGNNGPIAVDRIVQDVEYERPRQGKWPSKHVPPPKRCQVEPPRCCVGIRMAWSVAWVFHLDHPRRFRLSSGCQDSVAPRVGRNTGVTRRAVVVTHCRKPQPPPALVHPLVRRI